MKQKQGILLIVVVVLIVIGEIIRHNTNNSIWGWVFGIAALGTAILSATLKDSKLKKGYLTIMIVVALLFIFIQFFLSSNIA